MLLIILVTLKKLACYYVNYMARTTVRSKIQETYKHMKGKWKRKILNYAMKFNDWFSPKQIKERIGISSKTLLSNNLKQLVNTHYLEIKKINKRDNTYRFADHLKLTEYFYAYKKLPPPVKLTKLQQTKLREDNLNWAAKKDIKEIKKHKYLQFSLSNITLYGVKLENLSQEQRFNIVGNMYQIENSIRNISEITKQEDVFVLGKPLISHPAFVERFDVKELKEILAKNKIKSIIKEF